ncbi:MAG TPA: MFS transporter [Acidimicrobiales bacterium]|nr:MFS transporter [Acidimicrobiales bacterium]
MMYLGITVLSTIMLYYELYVGGSVTPLFLAKLNMSFTFLVYTLAAGAFLGALGSLFAGLADRVGRTNIVVIGLFLTALFTTFLIPASTSKWEFTIFGFIVGIVEGICLVATPALIRDFSPQVGRATAMGFWTSGPVLGSLVVTLVATHTMPASPSPSFWGHEYVICGIAGFVVFVLAALMMKELSPGLRDQLMVTMQDRALIEARAKGIDVEASLRNPFRQLVKPDVIISAVGISIFLLVYYTAVAFGAILFETVFGQTLKNANGIGNWNWTADVVAVIAFGFISDRVRVRKPFMIAGGVAAAVMLAIFIKTVGGGSGESYYTIVTVVALLSFFLGVAYVPWMASFTETVEEHNPALTATGLAIWGLIIRIVVTVAYLLIPVVIHSVTPLVQNGPTVQAIVAKYPAFQVPAATLATLQKDPTNATALAQAHAILGPNYISELVAASKAPASDVAYLEKHAPAVVKASKDAPGQWQDWYWICFGGTIFFLLTVPMMRGRWSPRKAREDEAAHEAMIQAEMAKLGVATTA